MAGETAIKDMTLEAVIAEAKAITPVLQRAFKEAGIALDMTKVTAFGEMDDASKGERLSQMNVRLHELSERKCVLEQAERGRREADELAAWLERPEGLAPVPT